MDMLPVKKLPVGAKWTYEVKLDGFRMEAIRSDAGVVLYSRRRKNMTREFREIAKALECLPPGTVIDGELTALDDRRFPRFKSICYGTFDQAHRASLTLHSTSLVTKDAT